MSKRVFVITSLMLVLVCVWGWLAVSTPAYSQDTMRKWVCEIFKCQSFIDLTAVIDAIKTDTTTIIDETGEIKASLLSIETKVDTIESHFPITVDPPEVDLSTIEASLARIEKQLSYMGKNEHSIWLESEGDTTVKVAIFIRGESLREINAWGLDMTFDSTYFSYAGIVKGSLCKDWALLDANEISPGVLRIGGVKGDGTGVVGDVIGTLCVVTFTKVGTTQATATCVGAYVDDIASFLPVGACVE